MMLIYGKIATQNNNSTATYTLPKAYTTDYVCITNATVIQHWVTIVDQTTTTITIGINDWGYATTCGFHYICYGY